MFRQVAQRYILEQLVTFKTGSRCCQQFCGSLCAPDQQLFAGCVAEMGLDVLPYVCNGIQMIKVYKKHCPHFLGEPPHLRLQMQSEKDLFLLQYRSDFVGSHHEMLISPDFFSPGCVRPAVPPHRFSLGLKQSMARQNIKGQDKFQRNCILQPYKQLLLEALQRSRVVVLNGDTSYDKSIGLPMYVIENCAERHAHCKIVCVERDQLLAIYNSERLAEHLGEKIGNTVAFQVHLQSRISEASNLIYTTASFLLRVLMGQNSSDSFRHISHVVVGDVQLYEAYVVLLLSELRAALRCHAHLRVILLSNSQDNSAFLKYFGEGEILQLQPQMGVERQQRQLPKMIRMEDIRNLVLKEYALHTESLAYAAPPNVMREFGNNREYLDSCLEEYKRSANDQSFNNFLYMVQGEYAPVNYRHSLYGSTAAIIASRLGKAAHLRELLELQADPFIMDEQNLNALSHAIAGGNMECIELLNHFCAGNRISMDGNASNLDYTVIIDLIRLLTTSCEWERGNILIFMPSYEQLVRLNFSILRHKLIGNIPQQVVIYMLHSNIEKEQLETMMKPSTECLKIILSTEIAENILYLHPLRYVIDSARIQRITHNTKTGCKESKFEWLPQEMLESRAMLLGRNAAEPGTCFQLIPNSLLKQLPKVHTPELLSMPLDRVCLTVKLLSPHTMVAEYLQGTIVRPPFLHIHNTVEYLKKIGVFDDLEDVTWLGCRLIDVPVDCQLGKLLVFAILLQCLDPVLTIVSFLSTADPLELPVEINGLLQPYVATIRSRMKQERKRLSAGIFSDHLLYLRLYQEWQNELRDDSPEMALQDEHHFVLNGILEKVCDMRTHLVGALRSSQLIHNQGLLSMHYINLKSNSWPMIKAALVAGLYPKICVTDASSFRFKSSRAVDLVLHPSSVLRELSMEPLKVSAQRFPSPWIIYGNETNSANCNSISSCTLITPLVVALFAGPTKLHTANVTPKVNNYNGSSTHTSNFYLDEWIYFTMDSKSAQLILKTRQYFYCTYIHFLQNCGSIDKWRRTSSSFTQIPRLFDTIEKVLTQEDLACGFTQPDNVGLRPKATPHRFIAAFNAAVSWDLNTNLETFANMNCERFAIVKLNNNNMKLTCLKKLFFMVYLSESMDIGFRKYSSEWIRDCVAKVVAPYIGGDKLTYVIIYNKNPDQFCAITVAKKGFGVVKLQEYFKNKVPIYELINICAKHNIFMPSFNERRIAFQIDPKVGSIILDLFAFRNNWLHNN